MTPAASTIRAKDTPRKKMAMKAAAAMAQSCGRCSARRATLIKASITITRTAALMPTKAASTSGTWPYQT